MGTHTHTYTSLHWHTHTHTHTHTPAHTAILAVHDWQIIYLPSSSPVLLLKSLPLLPSRFPNKLNTHTVTNCRWNNQQIMFDQCGANRKYWHYPNHFFFFFVFHLDWYVAVCVVIYLLKKLWFLIQISLCWQQCELDVILYTWICLYHCWCSGV